MSLSCGIVGLPNVGKSTLFNALLRKQQAFTANFPFATIEPNVGVVPVPDARLPALGAVVRASLGLSSLPQLVPATIEFIDIAGLVVGAYKGEGLGNKFLGHIREVDAVLHVVRGFTDANVLKEGAIDPVVDFKVVETELCMADLETLLKQKEPKGPASKSELVLRSVVEKLKKGVASGLPARDVSLSYEEKKAAGDLFLLTAKPILLALNVDEEKLADSLEVEADFAKKAGVLKSQVIAVNALVEEELASFSSKEAEDYLTELGVSEPGLERIIKKAFLTLDLISFFTTKGGKEVRAWTVKKGATAFNAAEVIHTDFKDKFIKAEVLGCQDFLDCGGFKRAREKGKVRQEGRDYKILDGDVIEFKVGA
jgi:ribosome-binding ATPase